MNVPHQSARPTRVRRTEAEGLFMCRGILEKKEKKENFLIREF